MAIVVTAALALPLTFLISQIYESAFTASDMTTANFLAQQQLETMKNTAYASVASASFTNYLGTAFNLTQTVTFVQGTALTAESLKSIEVSVVRSGSSNILADHRTYLARNVNFGI